MHCEYLKLLRLSLLYLLLLLLLANSITVTRAQQGQGDARGIIDTLKDGDFGLVVTRYKKRIILILCTPLFVCCACCALFCGLPCVCVVVLGCAGVVDSCRTKRRPVEPPTNTIVVIEKVPGKESTVPEETGAREFLYSPSTYTSNQARYAELRPGLVSYPKLPVAHGTIVNRDQLQTEYAKGRRNSVPVDDKSKDNRFNFLSMDDLNQIETRAKAYTLSRVKFGDSKV